MLKYDSTGYRKDKNPRLGTLHGEGKNGHHSGFTVDQKQSCEM